MRNWLISFMGREVKRHRPLWFTFFVTTVLYSSAFGSEQPSLNCDVGPVNKNYGGTSWLVYGCNDDKTVVIVAAPGSLAMPFVFSFAVKDGSYQLYGEGAGNKELTGSAYNELRKFSESDIKNIIVEARQLQRQRQIFHEK